MNEIVVGSEAVAAGRLTRHELSRWYRRIYHGIYVPKNAELTLRERAVAAWLASGRRAIIAGAAAAGLHESPWVDPHTPIEILGVKCRAQPGLIPRAERISSEDVTTLAGLQGDHPGAHRLRSRSLAPSGRGLGPTRRADVARGVRSSTRSKASSRAIRARVGSGNCAICYCLSTAAQHRPGRASPDCG